MPKETYYRFELAFLGEPQDVGILQGLEDTPLPFVLTEEIYSYFNRLPVPEDLETPDDSPIVSLFTKKGLKEFADALNVIIFELEPFNWQVIGRSFELDPQHAIYQDEYQVAFSRTDIIELTFFDTNDYKEVVSIHSDRKNPIQFLSPAKTPLSMQIELAEERALNLSSDNNSKNISKNQLSR